VNIDLMAQTVAQHEIAIAGVVTRDVAITAIFKKLAQLEHV
jgi:hypothetical protein